MSFNDKVSKYELKCAYTPKRIWIMERYYDVAQNCFFAKTRTVSRYVTNLYTKALKKIGLTPVQYSMLTAIQVLEEAKMNDLASTLKMDRTTINRNLKPLIRDGLVSMNESSDRRERLVSITKEGQELYEKGYEDWKKVQSEFKEILGDKNWDEMNDMLDNVIKVIAEK